MTITDVGTFISSVGFPIVCCIVLLYLIYFLVKTHKEEINQLTTAINNNTEVLKQLQNLMLGGENNGD